MMWDTTLWLYPGVYEVRPWPCEGIIEYVMSIQFTNPCTTHHCGMHGGHEG